MSYQHTKRAVFANAASMIEPTADTQPTQVQQPARSGRRRRFKAVRLGILLGVLLGGYLIFPGRINVLLMGIDRTPQGSAAGRSDTLILSTASPLQGYLGVLSIPRDLWVTIPGVGENRINAAHFFAEADVPGSGPGASVATVARNFGLELEYYIRIQFDGFRAFVDGIGGVPIVLENPVGKFPAGALVLDGELALAFVRDRTAGDDFSRMGNAQVFLKALQDHLIRPLVWPRLPMALIRLTSAIDSNLPIWVWPRYLFSWLRAGSEGIDARLIVREMVRGFTTNTGAQVLEPDWSRINPMLMEMFGQ
jgi:LCP family protein required for cell wall assembly